MTPVSLTLRGKPPRPLTAAGVAALADLSFRRGGGRGKAAISVSVVGDDEIRRLNRKYRGQDKVTDVLSFGVEEGLALWGHPSSEPRELGDLVISLPQVRRQAKQIGRAAADEFGLMVIHGVLHLLGHDHVTLAQENRMFALQHAILAAADIIL